MSLKKILFLTLISTLLSSCSILNPLPTNLKSPCVANDEESSPDTPCVRRKPVENALI